MKYIDALNAQLQAWVAGHYGPDAVLSGVASLGGHSGVTIGFNVRQGDQPEEGLVLKVPPRGVRPKDNFDVLRQVPLMSVLVDHGIAAPAIRWSSDDVKWFGQPYIVMTRLPGKSLPDIFDRHAPRVPDACGQLFFEAMQALMQIHSIDCMRTLQGWSTPRSLGMEIDHWVGVLRKSTNQAWIREGMELHTLLHTHAPRQWVTGIVHGDFYSNNWLFDKGKLTGVVDWESTTLGPILLDLGWVSMMYDVEAWGPMRKDRMGWHPAPEELIAAYGKSSSIALSDINWYRALAGYRLACNTAYYFEMHQSGKRHNPAWDVLGESFPFMLARARALLKT